MRGEGAMREKDREEGRWKRRTDWGQEWGERGKEEIKRLGRKRKLAWRKTQDILRFLFFKVMPRFSLLIKDSGNKPSCCVCVILVILMSAWCVLR